MRRPPDGASSLQKLIRSEFYSEIKLQEQEFAQTSSDWILPAGFPNQESWFWLAGCLIGKFGRRWRSFAF
jgi:hypothetical protein